VTTPATLCRGAKCGNWPELVVPGVNGWLFDPHNAGEERVNAVIGESLAVILNAPRPQRMFRIPAYSILSTGPLRSFFHEGCDL
jgi:hypothetical protein